MGQARPGPCHDSCRGHYQIRQEPFRSVKFRSSTSQVDARRLQNFCDLFARNKRDADNLRKSSVAPFCLPITTFSFFGLSLLPRSRSHCLPLPLSFSLANSGLHLFNMPDKTRKYLASIISNISRYSQLAFNFL